jgi:hypothetical protein
MTNRRKRKIALKRGARDIERLERSKRGESRDAAH